jgi:PHD/YefM family antitoxin component YafN of YafNO toxin-antitoxin module
MVVITARSMWNITMISITHRRVTILNRRKRLVLLIQLLIMRTHSILNEVDSPTDEVNIVARVVPAVVLINLVNPVVVTVVALYTGSATVLT